MTEAEMDAWIAERGVDPDAAPAEPSIRYRAGKGLPADTPSKAICVCGRKYRPIFGHESCCHCRKSAHRAPYQRRVPSTPTHDEKSPPAAPEAPQSIAKLYRAIRVEPGWPKGIVKVGSVVTICGAGDINRHAHQGTLIGTANRDTTLNDLERLMDGAAKDEPRTPKGDWVEARKRAVSTAAVQADMEAMV